MARPEPWQVAMCKERVFHAAVSTDRPELTFMRYAAGCVLRCGSTVAVATMTLRKLVSISLSPMVASMGPVNVAASHAGFAPEAQLGSFPFHRPSGKHP